MSSTADYVSLFKALPSLPPLTLLASFLLGLMRIAPIVAQAPFLGAKLPGGAKIGFALVLVLVMFPHILISNTHPLTFDMQFIGYALKEFLLGFIISFLVAIPFYIATSAGVLIDFLRGSSALQVGDPTMQTQSSPIGILYNQVLIVLFFQVDGPFIFLDALMQSYSFIPIDHYLPAHFFIKSHPFWQMIIHLLTKFTALSIQFAAPSLVAILMAEMFLGIANRLAPQVQIAFLGMAIKSILGIALLWAGWTFILQQMVKQALIWLSDLTKTLSSF